MGDGSGCSVDDMGVNGVKLRETKVIRLTAAVDGVLALETFLLPCSPPTYYFSLDLHFK